MNPEIFFVCVIMILLPCLVELGYKIAAQAGAIPDAGLTIC